LFVIICTDPPISNLYNLQRVRASYAAPCPENAASPWTYIFNTLPLFPRLSSIFAFDLPIDIAFYDSRWLGLWTIDKITLLFYVFEGFVQVLNFFVLLTAICVGISSTLSIIYSGISLLPAILFKRFCMG
jgi:hypothetical protein